MVTTATVSSDVQDLNLTNNTATQNTGSIRPSLTLPQTIGTCALNEYYDTATSQGSHFRIYYTRSFPNFAQPPIGTDPYGIPYFEASCVIQNPNVFATSGYPEFVTGLGASLEQSYLVYSQMG